MELTEKQIALLKATTQLSEEEIRQIHANFFENLPDGRLDKDHFTEIMQQFYPENDIALYSKYAFDVFDRNHDGTVDFNEFVLLGALLSKNDLETQLSFAFDLCDVSNDGQIDHREVTEFLTMMYKVFGEDDIDAEYLATEFIATFDTHGNQKISKEEFIAGCKNDSYFQEIFTV